MLLASTGRLYPSLDMECVVCHYWAPLATCLVVERVAAGKCGAAARVRDVLPRDGGVSPLERTPGGEPSRDVSLRADLSVLP